MSKYITLDLDKHISVKYENIYSINGVLTYLSIDNINLPNVCKWTNTYHWRPEVKLFNSQEEMNLYINNLEKIETIELSVLGDILWAHNIGHALFDGLYPLYLALVKFGYINDDFTLLTNIDTNDRGIKLAKEIFIQFSGNNIIYDYNNLDKNKNYHFKVLISGTGCTGNRVVNNNYTLYGEKEYNALTYFKERIYKKYNYISDKPINNPLKAIVINNKRYNDYELNSIKSVIQKNINKNIDIKFIDWANYSSFSEQLKEIQDTDIHITGPGTGMLYMPFLKKGAVNINLGYMEKTQTNGARPNIKIENTSITDFIFPGYMDQCLCSGTRYLNTIYYDRYNFNYVEEQEFSKIINKAINICGIILENNLNIDALIFKEYCKRSKKSDELCHYLTDISFMIELFIHEHPVAINPSFVEIDLLKKIKKEFNYGSKYDIVP